MKVKKAENNGSEKLAVIFMPKNINNEKKRREKLCVKLMEKNYQSYENRQA